MLLGSFLGILGGLWRQCLCGPGVLGVFWGVLGGPCGGLALDGKTDSSGGGEEQMRTWVVCSDNKVNIRSAMSHDADSLGQRIM